MELARLEAAVEAAEAVLQAVVRVMAMATQAAKEEMVGEVVRAAATEATEERLVVLAAAKRWHRSRSVRWVLE